MKTLIHSPTSGLAVERVGAPPERPDTWTDGSFQMEALPAIRKEGD